MSSNFSSSKEAKISRQMNRSQILVVVKKQKYLVK